MSVREFVQRWIDAPITIQRNSPPHDLLNNLLSGTASISLLALILSPIIGANSLWQSLGHYQPGSARWHGCGFRDQPSF
jgi:hypothetical protein